MRAIARRWLAAFGTVVLWLVGATAALAIERGTTGDGWPYLAGGYGVEERGELAGARKDYRLRVATAARGSGAYLARVRIRIADASGRVFFDRELPGPLLLIDVAPGRYTIRASLPGEEARVTTVIGRGDLREVVFYFAVPSEALPMEDRNAR